MTTPNLSIQAPIPWDEPADSFLLFRGPITYRMGELTTPEIDGSVHLVLRAGAHLHWSVDVESFENENDEIWDYFTVDAPESIEFTLLDKCVSFPVAQTSPGRGIVMRQSPDAETSVILHQALVHWVNIPDIDLDDTFVFGDWLCKVTPRPRLTDAFKTAKAQYLNVVTHTMTLCRADGEPFSHTALSEFLTGLQFGMSFALSRWVAPIMPVGFINADEFVWTEWLPWRIDPPMYGAGRWWVEHRPQDLWSFLGVWMTAWHDPAKRSRIRFLVTSAIASGEGTFVEQRLLTSLAAIENMSWIVDVLSGKRSEQKWRSRKSDQRTRALLTEASISIHLDAALTPALFHYAKDNNLGDGPKAITHIRDRLTHPKDTEPLYDSSGLIAEAARLTRKYLDLLLLHYLGYEGRYSDRTRVRGWVGESEPVPWAGEPACNPSRSAFIPARNGALGGTLEVLERGDRTNTDFDEGWPVGS